MTNTCDSATSNAATLTVNTLPVIAEHPQSQILCQGGSVTFTVSATGTAPLSYQWRKGGSNIPGATGSIYTINPVGTADAGSYDCVVTNTCNSATSNTATLTVNTAPVITSTAVTTATVNQGYSYDVDATGIPAPTYSLVTSPGGMTIDATTGLIQWTPTEAQLGSNPVTVRGTNPCGSADQSFTIAVLGITPVITSTPVTTATVNQAYSYDVDATGIPTPTYTLVTSPTGMTIDGTTGVIQWTPTAPQLGANSVTVHASNGVTLNAEQSFNIDVTAVHGLTVSSTAGGSVLSPGEGTFQYNHGEQVVLQAKADPLFTFVGWRGGLSANVNPYPLTMDADYTIKAHFESLLDVLYVDDNAPGDPGPGDPNLSDPNENGTMEHPFDSVQEAIEVARNGAKVMVRPGTYLEVIDLLGKRIEVNGLNADDPNILDLPVINGQGKDTVVRCTQREDPNCILVGFVITGGQGRLAGGILCVGSSPSIMNCLIVGNRATESDAGGGVYCQDSNALFTNCTISGNYGGAQGAGLWFKDSLALVSNSIVWGNEPAEVLTAGSIQPVMVYTNVAGGWLGVGNLDVDPLFAKPGYWANPNDPTKAVATSDSTAVWVPGDYHVMSKAGRWDPVAKVWINDTATSTCIDAGDPASPVGAEPIPNGNRINLGAYGGTNQASRSSH